MDGHIAFLLGERRKDEITDCLKDAGMEFPFFSLSSPAEDWMVVAAVEQAQNAGALVIVSAGAVSRAIMRVKSVPLVQIKRSSVSFTRAIKNALSGTSRIAIACLPGWHYQAALRAQEISAIAIEVVCIEQRELLPQVIADLQAHGVEQIIGYEDAVEEASHQGVRATMVPFEPDDIYQAVKEAQYMELLLRESLQHIQMLGIVENCSPEGIVVLDDKGRVLEINRTALALSGRKRDEMLGRSLADTPLSGLDAEVTLRFGVPVSGQLARLPSGQVMLDIQPVLMDGALTNAVLIFESVDRVQTRERVIRKKLHTKGHVASATFDSIVGESKAIHEVINVARRYASVDSTVLIYGPTGSGKEMFAQGIHNASSRRSQPFVVINCAALPESILESILFGYEPGAFTGARNEGKRGLFEVANGGTVFLDEISEMSLSVQARFLRVLQEKEIMPVGSDNIFPVDVRVLAATNRDLSALVREGKFREDLFYRISVLTLSIPPLCERRADIAPLALYFLLSRGQALGLPRHVFSQEALELICASELPGNVRQLANLVERALVISDSEVIGSDIAASVFSPAGTSAGGQSGADSDTLLRKTLLECGGSRIETARRLGISTSTLWRRLKQMQSEATAP